MKIRKLLYGVIASSMITPITFTAINQTVVSAKSTKVKNKKTSEGFISYFYYTKYVGTHGTIYKSYTLKKKLTDLSHYKNKVFKSKDIVEYRMPDGSNHYFYEIKGNGITGFIDGKYLHHYKAPKKSTNDSNDNNSDGFKVNNDKLSNFYTNDEIEQIQQYQNEAKQIGNDSKDTYIYSVKPQYKDSFSTGALNSDFINRNVRWINFFREMYGLSSVVANSSWNIASQYGATDLASANQGLSHGLVGLTKPSFVSQQDWDKGAAATNQSNLSNSNTPYDIVGLYINDDGNEDPGHREWLLGGINQVGIGQAGDYNDLMVFDAYNKNWPTPEKDIEFPKSGLFPFDMAYDTYWSYSLASGNFNGTPTITIKDNTDNKNVPVSKVHTTGSTYGYFNQSVAFLPDSNYIKLNHSYTISISNTDNGTYTYTTKLFDLGYKIVNHQDD